MEMLERRIRDCIEDKIDRGFKDFIIYPFGEVGMMVKAVLNQGYGIQEKYVLDRRLCKYNTAIYSSELLNTIDCSSFCVIISSINPRTCKELKQLLQNYFPEENIGELTTVIRLNVT